MRILKRNGTSLERLCNRQVVRKRRVENVVRKVVDEVQQEGDSAVLRYTRRFDGVKLAPKQQQVTEAEISGAFQDLDQQFVLTIKQAIQNVEHFHKRPRLKPVRMKSEDGTVLCEKFDPIESVGVYIPGGTASLVSTVYMTVIPAQCAGVKRIVMVTPPKKDGRIDPHILAVASLLGVDEIYKVGGAQAIAALAFGTKTIPRVHKIVGPGNDYVAEAKRQVFGYVDIDTIAGPSEVAVIADKHANPDYVIADLRGETEHVGGVGFLITTSKALAQQVAKAIPTGDCILVKSLDEAVDMVNQIAPEHLNILVNAPQRIVNRIKYAGAMFVGPFTPTTVGDYIAGPSHVLPTGGAGKAFSGLSVDDFIRRTHVVTYTKKALERVREPLRLLTKIEGMPRHMEAVDVRFAK
jgi:histidinol dehydrogenase